MAAHLATAAGSLVSSPDGSRYDCLRSSCSKPPANLHQATAASVQRFRSLFPSSLDKAVAEIKPGLLVALTRYLLDDVRRREYARRLQARPRTLASTTPTDAAQP